RYPLGRSVLSSLGRSRPRGEGDRPQADLAYRRLKRSTRPAVSISFCLPEKNGWHSLQISRRTSSLVERASKVLPQAHTTVTMCSWGWMSVFTVVILLSPVCLPGMDSASKNLED